MGEAMINFNGHVFHVWWVGCFSFVLAGCTTSVYDVELEPTDDGIKRTLTFTQNVENEDGTPTYSKKERRKLSQIARGYDLEKGSDGGNVTSKFTGLFANQMPQDIGGSGEYRRWETSLGSVSVYVERFRGSDDLLFILERWGQHVDDAVDQMTAWFESELKDEEGFQRLQTFLDGEFRRDIKNVGLYFWPLQFQKRLEDDGEDEWTEQAMRAAHYLAEREYFAIEDIPSLTRAAIEYESGNRTQCLYEILQRLFASKMGTTESQPIPACLNFLASEEAITKSSSDYLRSTDEYKKLLAEWEASDQRAPKPKPSDVWNSSDLAAQIIRFGGEVVSVRLKSGTVPFATNGEWDAETKTVKWRRSVAVLEPDDDSIGLFAFALWSQPNSETQIDHFGRTVLDEFALGQYCVWYHGLNKLERQQWDSFLSTITPDSNIIPKLESFRFHREPTADPTSESDEDLSGIARSLIANGLADE